MRRWKTSITLRKSRCQAFGPPGWKLYTGRSRNELVATEFRIFVSQSAGEIRTTLFDFLRIFLEQAKD